jgi:hypothetical protein
MVMTIAEQLMDWPVKVSFAYILGRLVAYCTSALVYS